MNTARISTLRLAPEGALYAQEMNDRNTCRPCHEVDGRWLGNISDLAQASVHPQYRTGVLALYPDGAYGGYIHCLGGINCRGTVVGVWRPKTVGDGAQ
jgi:nitrate/TMAO reductase-like tetraheme cytochrome c subunit